MDIVSIIVFGLFMLVCAGVMVLLNRSGGHAAARDNRRRWSVWKN